MKLSRTEARKRGRALLAEAGIGDAFRDADLLLMHVTGLHMQDLLSEPGEPLDVRQAQAYEELLQRRALRIPLAYLTNSWSFMGLEFKTDARALIPGQDTEFVTEEAMKHLHDGMRFLDLCTGTGCIALSLARYSNDTTGVATDLSEEALSLARENAADLRIDNVRFVLCDLFPADEAPFDLIVSNPPYIRTREIDTLQEEVRLHAPRMALDGGEDGLSFYRRIITSAPRYLCRGGYLVLETGYDQTEAVETLMEERGFLHIGVHRDYAGNPRCVTGCYYV
ncbi:MAG: peptide chain release factor N(5)-glutamine methyltransferase [Lachnospiraceae bacterium]|nr:peptide chain release factor N(5)-glutamine methyltransferase [Lachnospiraceae bacterium]